MKNSSTKLTGWKMLVIAGMLMLATGSISAQQPGHHGPPPPPPNFDSIFVAHIDSFLAHHLHDSIPPRPIDTVVFHRRDSIPNCHHDSIGWHHDTIPAPPLPPDTGHAIHHDSIPPFPIDTNWRGGGPAPFDTNLIHHKDLLVGSSSDNSPATMSIFPNPVVSTSTMNIQNAGSTVTFRLYDMNGRVAMELNNLGNGSMSFSKGNLTPGIYLYEMIDGNTKAATGRILIQ